MLLLLAQRECVGQVLFLKHGATVMQRRSRTFGSVRFQRGKGKFLGDGGGNASLGFTSYFKPLPDKFKSRALPFEKSTMDFENKNDEV